MREIKFRAWSEKDKEFKDMQEVALSLQDNNNILAWYFEEDGGHHVVLSQFTGLKDKNGDEIYDGDICHWQDQRGTWISKVEYSGAQFGLWAQKDKDNGWFCPLDEICIEDCEFKVIGNIYENPELLKNE